MIHTACKNLRESLDLDRETFYAPCGWSDNTAYQFERAQPQSSNGRPMSMQQRHFEAMLNEYGTDLLEAIRKAMQGESPYLIDNL